MDLIEFPTTSQLTDVPQLKYFCTRFVSISLFQANIRWRKLPDVVRSLKSWLAEVDLPPIMKTQLHIGIGETVREVQRWGEKHIDLFEEEKPRLITGSRILRVQRCEHLRMFYGCITWKANKYEIDDLATAEKIILRECADWPQMQFQFACAYAMLDLLTNESMFDRIRRRAFAKKLSGHCLYDFWLTILNDSIAWEKMFSSDAVAPKQKLSLVFQFAIINGYFELMNFIWARVSEAQREYIGMLQWRRVCFKAKHRDVMRFLCNRLCLINPNGLARITWNTFYDALHRSFQHHPCQSNEYLPFINRNHHIIFGDAGEGQNDTHDDDIRKLEFLLENCCSRLRKAMLSMENFKAITDAFAYNQADVFAILLEHLDGGQLRSAREFIDRIYDRKQDKDQVRGFRQMIMRRQNTID